MGANPDDKKSTVPYNIFIFTVSRINAFFLKAQLFEKKVGHVVKTHYYVEYIGRLSAKYIFCYKR